MTTSGVSTLCADEAWGHGDSSQSRPRASRAVLPYAARCPPRARSRCMGVLVASAGKPRSALRGFTYSLADRLGRSLHPHLCLQQVAIDERIDRIQFLLGGAGRSVSQSALKVLQDGCAGLEEIGVEIVRPSGARSDGPHPPNRSQDKQDSANSKHNYPYDLWNSKPSHGSSDQAHRNASGALGLEYRTLRQLPHDRSLRVHRLHARDKPPVIASPAFRGRRSKRRPRRGSAVGVRRAIGQSLADRAQDSR